MEPKRKGIPIRRKKKYNKQKIVCLLLFLLITMPAVTGCIYFGIQYYGTKQQAQEAWKQIEKEQLVALEQSKTIQYSEEDMKLLLESSKTEHNEVFLNKLKELMSSGEGTTAMLRYFYPEDIIVIDKKKYNFFPILDTLKKHSYNEEQFVLNEEEIEYIENEEVISTKGIDVSKYQQTIDWEKVKKDNVDYAFIRLGLRGYGTGKLVVDETYEQNVIGASDAGIKTGVYFVTQAITVAEAIEEAEFVIENLAPYKDRITYPVALDIEEVPDSTGRSVNLTKEERTQISIAFCEKIKEAGYKPMLYGNLKSFFIMLELEKLEEYPKWFAIYSTPIYYPYEFAIWQYTKSGKVNGIKGNVDINVGFMKE